MTSHPLLAGLLASAALSLLLGCGEEVVTDAPVPTPPAPGQDGGGSPAIVDDDPPGVLPPDGPPAPEDVAAGKARGAELRAEMNRQGRGLLASFESRVYGPVRNAGVTHAEGHVDVRTSGVDARYAFTFDASAPLDRRSIVTRIDGEKATRPALPAGTAKQVFDLVQLSLNGPYRYVVNYLPPTDLLLTPGRDGTSRIVTAQPHKHDVLVSYSFDERDLVAVRGTSVRPQKEIVYFAWSDWRGRHLLEGVTFHGSDAALTLSYAEQDGVVLLERAAIRKQGAGFDAVFKYDRLDRGEPVDPLVPRLPGEAPPRRADGDREDPDAPK